jgi:antitoxin (DNA-binding transcriptional repressor) of toxin-antitoxin stability system
MEQIAISKFKVSCLAILERVRKWRLVLVTRFGEPVVQVIPPTPPKRPARWLGSLAHTGRIRGDIVAPVSDERDWSVFRF